jgi:tetratricopeptide (TPR) repeat protein
LEALGIPLTRPVLGDDIDAALISARCFFELGRVDDSIAILEHTCARKDAPASAHYNLGTALHDVGEPDESRRAYEKAVEIDGTYYQAYDMLSLLALERSDFAGATVLAARAHGLRPYDEQSLVRYAGCLVESHRTDEALHLLVPATARYPGNVDLMRCLGKACAMTGQVVAAEKAFRRALDLQPGNPLTLHQYGMSLLLARNFERAIQVFEAAQAAGYPEAADIRGRVEACAEDAERVQPALVATGTEHASVGPEAVADVEHSATTMSHRLVPHPAFEIPLDDASIHAYAEDDGTTEVEKFVDASVVAAVREQMPAGASVRVMPASVGRGAEGYGLALEIIGLVANVGGAIATTVAAARLVRAVYVSLCQKLTRRPLISLGTAQLLAAADLAERISIDQFRVVGAGDLDSHSPDSSYTGADYFWVALEHGPTLYLYAVDAFGRVRLMGELAAHDAWTSPMDPRIEDGGC